MPAYQLQLVSHVAAPVERVFDCFADHRRFMSLYGLDCRRVVDGSPEPDGLGSVRRIFSGPLAFEETIVVFERNRRIHYQVTKGGPLKNHLGRIEFEPTASGTTVRYTVDFEPRIPLTGGALKSGLQLAWKLHAPRVLKQL